MHRINRQNHGQKISEKHKQEEFADFLSKLIPLYEPHQVYVFGSFLTSDFDEDSDFDLVVTFEEDKAAARAWRLRPQLRAQVKRNFDLIPMTIADFEKKRNIGGIAFVAYNEGKLVFERENFASRIRGDSG